MATALKLKGKGETPKTENKPSFAIVLPDVDGLPSGYKAGQQLTEPRHFREFFSELLSEVAPIPDHATNAQIEAVLRNVKHSDNDDNAKKMQNYIDALSNAQWVKDAAKAEVEATSKARLMGSAAITAINYGRVVTDEMVNLVVAAVKAERDKDAGPVELAYNMLANMPADFWNECPEMNTQYRVNAKKGNRVPTGYRLPDDTFPEHQHLPIFNGPWNRYAVKDSENKWVPHSWVHEFVGEKIAASLEKQFKDANTLLTTDAIPDNCDPTALELKKNNRINLLRQLAADRAFEFQRRVRVTSDAITYAHTVRQLKDLFDYDLRLNAQVYDRSISVADAARKRKPFAICEVVDGTNMPSVPLEMSMIKRLDPRRFIVKDETGKIVRPSIDALTAPRPRKPASEQKSGDGTPRTVGTEVKVSNVEDLAKALSSSVSYLSEDGKRDMLMAKVRQPGGGALAWAMVTIANIVTDNDDTEKALRAIAHQYNAEQLAAMGEKAVAANAAKSK